MSVTDHQKAIKLAKKRSTSYQVLKQAQCEKCFCKIDDVALWVIDGLCSKCRK